MKYIYEKMILGKYIFLEQLEKVHGLYYNK